MKVKTSELTGPALDWAVAKAEGWEMNHHAEGGWFLCNDVETMPDETLPEYSTDWAQGGPIIECEGMQLSMEDRGEWHAMMWWDDTDGKGEVVGKGSTPLIAAMRCYVASRLGEEVDIPEELK